MFNVNNLMSFFNCLKYLVAMLILFVIIIINTL